MGAVKGQPWTMAALLVRSYVRVQFLEAAAITYYTQHTYISSCRPIIQDTYKGAGSCGLYGVQRT